jgi:hypothetical protein
LCSAFNILKHAVVEQNRTITKFVDDFYEADEIYGFTNDDLELDLSDGEIDAMNLMDIDANDEIPSAQVPPTLPTPTPSNQSSSSTPIDANTNASSSTTVNNVNANSSTFALPLVGLTNNSTGAVSATPFLDPIQQQIQQHELLKQLNIMNKELKLLRTQPAKTNTTVPLQNVTNLLGIVANVLPSTSTNAEMEDSSKSKKKPAGAYLSGTRRGRKPYPLDANGNKIRPDKENQKTTQTQKKSKK